LMTVLLGDSVEANHARSPSTAHTGAVALGATGCCSAGNAAALDSLAEATEPNECLERSI
jgi:hypothetical protein